MQNFISFASEIKLAMSCRRLIFGYIQLGITFQSVASYTAISARYGSESGTLVDVSRLRRCSLQVLHGILCTEQLLSTNSKLDSLPRTGNDLDAGQPHAVATSSYDTYRIHIANKRTRYQYPIIRVALLVDRRLARIFPETITPRNFRCSSWEQIQWVDLDDRAQPPV